MKLPDEDTSWVTETTTMNKQTLLELAAYAAEHGYVVRQNGRQIYPLKPQVKEKTLAPRQVPGVAFTQTTRIGDEVRNRYLDHLTDMFTGGHLDEMEFNARAEAALKCKTEEELKYLVSDLPEMVVRKIIPPAPSRPPRPSLLLSGAGMTQTMVIGELMKHPLPVPALAVLVICLVFWGVVLLMAILARVEGR